ncbi:MAG: hypothetical protein JRI23_20065, partial [Deltaproteobacteria bacterium]|nr:hypothetical protein [Deltaproteobacteria bacterium]MBW2534171.1 hypothetical protein [Deltaproteobacteria bacterium]
LRSVERLVSRARRASRVGELADASRALILRDARQRLERMGAARSDDPVLRHHLARVLYGLFEMDGDRSHLRAAVGHLRMVTRSRAPSTLRAEALNDLAMCYARLDRHPQETTTYDQALQLDPHAEAQAILLANQAEGFMAQGNVTRALRGYRASIAATPAYALHRIAVTTWWGYAVALDRSGNLAGALRQIETARSYDPEDTRLGSDSWVYLPAYDEHWYAALGHWQHGRQAQQPQERLRAYEQALLAWTAYRRAAPPDDRWQALARIRHDQCREEQRRARDRAAE